MRFHAPDIRDFDTEEDFLVDLDAYEAALLAYEDRYIEEHQSE